MQSSFDLCTKPSAACELQAAIGLILPESMSDETGLHNKIKCNQKFYWPIAG